VKLRVWLTIASVVLGVLQVSAQYVCATAGELGIAGRSPLLQFMVWDGGWKPVEAYVEGVDALFVPAPLARGNEATISRVAQRGVLPPGVLGNETLICFKPGSGISEWPRDTPRGLLVAYKAGGVDGHVLIVDVADVDGPAQPLVAAMLPNNFTKVQVVERRWVEGPAGRAVELAQVGALPSPISYAASFSLRSFFGAQLSPGELRCSYFDVPSETSYVAVYFKPGTDPGTYYYEVKRNGALASSGVVSYSGGPFGTALWASETGGRATYLLCIQNKDDATRSVSAAVYLYVRNQVNIVRDDAYYTNVIDVDMSTSQWRSHRTYNTYLYFPGYVDIDAASVIQIYVSALFNQEAVRRDSQGRYYINVYWGQLYMGTLYGISTASGVKFEEVLTVPTSLYWIITNTRGYNGTILIGPFNYPTYPVKGSARVDVFVERPVELANASSAVLIHYATVRLRADASYHDVMPWSSGFKGVSFKTRVEFVFSGSAGHKLVVSVNPYKWNNVENDIRYRTITITVKGYDQYGNPVKFNAGGQFDLNAQSSTGQLARLIEWASIILQGLDLGKAVVDYLAKAPSSFPIVSFITIALDAYVNAIQEKGTVQISPDGTIMKIGVYIGGVNGPIFGVIPLSVSTSGMYTLKVDSIMFDGYVEVVQGSRFAAAGSAYSPRVLIYDFPFRTLTCGFQEAGLYSGSIPVARLTVCNVEKYR